MATGGRMSLGYRTRIGLIVAVAVAAFSVGWLVGRADAYPINIGPLNPVDFHCWDRLADVDYWFDDSLDTWSSDLKSRFTDGANNWGQLDDHNGNHFVSSQETSSSGVAVRLLVTEDELAGETYCSEGLPGNGDVETITLTWGNGGAYGLADFEGVSHHEMGHAHSLVHVANGDSHDGDTPTMISGCSFDLNYGSFEDAHILRSREQDDVAQLAWLFDNGDVNANGSFEDMGTWTNDLWGFTGSASLTTYTTGGKNGSNFGRVSGGGAIYQTVRIVDPGEFRAKVQHRKYNQYSTGTVTIQLRAAQINYDTDGDGTCDDDYFPHWDLDEPISVGSMMLRESNTAAPSANWSFLELDTAASNNAWTGASNWDGVDVRVQLVNDMTMAGDPWPVDIDWLRIKDSG
jgi:hypothetical protein